VRAKPPASANTDDAHYFCTDEELTYEPFYEDFGPLNMSKTYRFCEMVKRKLASAKHKGKRIVYWCHDEPTFKANSAALVTAYQIIELDRKGDATWESLAHMGPFLAFRDASTGVCDYKLTVHHCIRAWAKAKKFQFYDFTTFDPDHYDHYEQVENGDLNILVPDKFLAFSGPSNVRFGPDGYPTLTPEDYLDIFGQYGVTSVVRLNKTMYDKERFTNTGLDHHDMYYIDGTTPSPEILANFLRVSERAEGMVAVHCKAGLGRTGTCVGAYMMKHYVFTAAEAIAWIRLCRPGSVIGPQQTYLRQIQLPMWEAGKQFYAAQEAAAAAAAAATADAGVKADTQQTLAVNIGRAPLRTPTKAAKPSSYCDARSPNAGIVHRQYVAESPKKAKQ
jgi:cell division cycle 14